MARFQKKWQPPWSGPTGKGPSLSGTEATSEGLLPLPELIKWLRLQPQMKGKGRLTQKRIRMAVLEDEKHHWKDSRGVRLVEFYDRDRALREVVELGEYF